MEKKVRSASLMVILVGAILFGLVLAMVPASPVRAAPAPLNPYGVEQMTTTPQAYKVPGLLSVAHPSGMTATLRPGVQDKGVPVPTDFPFGPNVQVWNDPQEESEPTMAIQPTTGDVYLAFQHNNGADWDVYVTMSTDSGATWAAPVAVANSGANEVHPSMAVTSTGAFALFYEQDGFSDRIYLIQSIDGLTWTGYYLTLNPASGLSLPAYPSVAAEIPAGAYSDGVMAAIQVWCTSATNCGSGAHTVLWLGSSAWSTAPPNFDLGGPYWIVKAARTSPNDIVNFMHPSASWSSAGFFMGMDDQWWHVNEWRYDWLITDEAGATVVTGWLSGAKGTGTGLFGAGYASGNVQVTASTFLNATAFPSNPTNHNIVYFYTSDGGASYGGNALDAAATDQRSLSIFGLGVDWHITYYSDATMTHQTSADSGANFNGAEKVSDNTGTAVNADRATAVYVGPDGVPHVAWQDNRDGNVNIYTAGFVTHPYWINATCGGVAFSAAILIDGTTPGTTPATGRWSDQSVHIVSAQPRIQPAGFCKNCVFKEWFDGVRTYGTQAVTVTASGPITLLARFDANYRVNVAPNPGGVGLNVRFDTQTGNTVTNFTKPGNYQAQAPTPQIPGGPDTRYVFKNWSGDVTGIANPINVNVAGPGCMNITANFGIEYQITVTTAPVTQLNISFDGGAWLQSPQAYWAAPGTQHTLATQSPQADPMGSNDLRYKFQRWAGGPPALSWVITVSGPTTYTANFIREWRIQIRANLPDVPGPQLAADSGTCYDSLGNLLPAPQGYSPMFCWFEDNSNPALLISTPQFWPTVSPVIEYDFTEWSDHVTDTVRQIGPITGPATYQSMWTAKYKLTMVVDASCGSSTVTPNSGWYPRTTLVDIGWTGPTGLPAGERYLFRYWRGTGAGSTNSSSSSAQVTMTDGITETAFCFHQFSISLDTSPTGREYSVDGPIVVTGAHQYWWEAGSTHWFNVTTTTQTVGNTRYVFTQWDDGNVNANHQLVVSTFNTYKAQFSTQHKLTLLQIPIAPASLGNPTCVGSTDCWFVEGTLAQVSMVSSWPASPQYIKFEFTQWTGDVTRTTASFTVTMDGPKSETANWDTWYQVNIVPVHGSATCAPNADCWYKAEAQATLSVTSPFPPSATDTQYLFSAWSVDSTSASNPLTMAINNPKNLTAVWSTQYMVTITSTCGGNTACGTPTGAGWHNAGTTVTVSIAATDSDAGKNYDFKGWTGAVTSGNQTVTVTMDGPKVLTASWSEHPKEQTGGLDVMWILIIIIIIVVVALVIIFMMMRKKPTAQEEMPEGEVPAAPPPVAPRQTPPPAKPAPRPAPPPVKQSPPPPK